MSVLRDKRTSGGAGAGAHHSADIEAVRLSGSSARLWSVRAVRLSPKCLLYASTSATAFGKNILNARFSALPLSKPSRDLRPQVFQVRDRSRWQLGGRRCLRLAANLHELGDVSAVALRLLV